MITQTNSPTATIQTTQQNNVQIAARSSDQVQSLLNQSWQQQLNQLIKTPEELFTYLQIPLAELKGRAALKQFPLRVTHSFARRMRKGDLQDPLLLQVLPQDIEMTVSPGYTLDPLAEMTNNPHPGLIHKYQGRVLLIASTHCAVNCRYCFRRHFPYHDNNPGHSQWQAALDYIRRDTSISEVILSGGDPLSVSDRQLQWLSQSVADITHIKRLRIHSRLPVVLPGRIDDRFLSWLNDIALQKIMVIHSNHPHEINDEVHSAMDSLRQIDVTTLNQTVLLKGINDSPEVLANLSEALFSAKVLPYYLHLLDPVQGATHFDMSQAHALTIYTQLRDKLPGFLLPKLVREEAGARAKTPVL